MITRKLETSEYTDALGWRRESTSPRDVYSSKVTVNADNLVFDAKTSDGQQVIFTRSQK